MNMKLMTAVLTLIVAGLAPQLGVAQVISTTVTTVDPTFNGNIQENFTGTTTNNNWYFGGGACLTAATSTSGTTAPNPGQVPGCIGLPYYSGVTLVGGNPSSTTGQSLLSQGTPDTTGALRLTNSSNNEAGAIISNFSFPLASVGLSVSFTTETYIGDSGGTGSDGADGISFFLQDASTLPTLGDFGGSLGYTCSNVNNNGYQGYDGMVGAYLGLGIDEYGNFLNGTEIATTTTNSSGVTTTSYSYSQGADNTASGFGYVPGRIGLRGPGSVAWAAISTNPATKHYYPTTLTSDQQRQAVQQVCRSGIAWDYSGVTALTLNDSGHYTNATINGLTNSYQNSYHAVPVPGVAISDYPAIAAKTLTTQIAKEGALYRGYGTGTTTTGTNYGIPITYNLTITTGGLLSVSYSYNNGNFQPIISGQDITKGGLYPIPALVRFGFAGSTGGSRNIHEVMCFQAQPSNSSASSAGLNQKQVAKVRVGTQVYFAFYNPNNWTGNLTSQYLDQPPGDTNPNDLQIDPSVNWDASCVLTGVPSGQTCAKTGAAGPIAAEGPSSRTILSWSGTAGIPLQWTSLTSAEQTALDTGDTSQTATRLNYLRGDRTNEQNVQGQGLYRTRTSVLADIIDSSPTWIGPPGSGFPSTFSDLLYPSQTPAENSGESYATYASAPSGSTNPNNQQQTRMNVVYAGANDGLLHGFRTGSYNASNQYVGTTTSTTVGGVTTTSFNGTNNDGQEVIAYMPGYVVNKINSYTTTLANDYSNPLYSHHFSVDASPGAGDLFYANSTYPSGAWHTWIVGGLGPGGPAIYALDVTDPTQFAETNAANLVVGEWSTYTTTTTTTTTTGGVTTTTTTPAVASTTLNCVGDVNGSPCGNNLGNTYGIPQIRRFHNNPTASVGSWGFVFGNGFSSVTGDAGIYVGLVSQTTSNVTPTVTFYYLSTGWATAHPGVANGIAYVTPADLDGDHTVDYIYAGDLQGNVWRFDVTSNNPASWTVTSTPVYNTGGPTQPITTKLIVASIATTSSPRVVVEFGTGRQTPMTNNTAATYSSSQQYLMGIWDWNMTAWNAQTGVTQQYASLPTTTSVPAFTNGTTALQVQTIVGTYGTTTGGAGYNYRTVSNSPVCWAGASLTGCTSNTQYGWYMALPYGCANASNANGPTTPGSTSPVCGATGTEIYEQVIFSPVLDSGAFIVNTTIPPTTSLATCSSTEAGGWTMAINPATGGSFTQSFFGDANHNFLNVNSQSVSGIALSGTGSPSVVTAGTAEYLVTQTVGGTGSITAINPPGNVKGSRLTWIQRR